MSDNIEQTAVDNLRLHMAAMVEQAKSGHPGGAMGAADYIYVLYSEFLNFKPNDPNWKLRDRFFLDAGHMSPMLYSILAAMDKFSLEDIKNFRQWGSPTPGHPELNVQRGIENTSGPLGQGHAYGAGAALAEAFLHERLGEWYSHYTYAFISDGGVQEEISQGVGRLAGHLGLGKFIMYYDANDVQLSTNTSAATSEDTAKKYQAWGWHVQSIDGNDREAIRQALRNAQHEPDMPSLIIGKTVMGMGTRSEGGRKFEGHVSLHGQPLSKAGGDFAATAKHLGGSADNPFVWHKNVREHFDTILQQKQQAADKQQETVQRVIEKTAGLQDTIARYFNREPPETLDWNHINEIQKDGVATRAAGSAVLGELARTHDNMLVFSADLANSDKTDGFLKETTPISNGNFKGAFVHAGVSEFTMGAMALGATLHGGVFAACGTFFAFSDYMKPVLRMAALMEQPVVFIYTHDAFRVGEDGPTHQPIEQEAQIRLLEQVKSHQGRAGLIAYRPADAYETTIAWKLSLEEKHRPSSLILTRQNVESLNQEDRTKQSQQASKGAYALVGTEEPQLVVIANGSEVSTALAGSKLFAIKHGVAVRVVSAISEGLFREQSEEYQQELLPQGVPRFGVTAGLANSLERLVGTDGEIHELNHFGYSAPYQKLDEEFGFTAENIANKLEAYAKSKEII